MCVHGGTRARTLPNTEFERRTIHCHVGEGDAEQTRRRSFAPSQGFPSVIAGPNLGYEAASYYSVRAAGVLFDKLDVALDLGGGVTFKISPKLDVFLQSCFSLGLINVVDTSIEEDTTAKSRGIQVRGARGA